MGWGKLRLRTVPAPILGSTASVGQNIRLLMTKHHHRLQLWSLFKLIRMLRQVTLWIPASCALYSHTGDCSIYKVTNAVSRATDINLQTVLTRTFH